MSERSFWLVQRLYLSPRAEFREAFPQAKIDHNPFGYGRLGDYELDYMGSAEFEWGAIPEAGRRLQEGTLQLRSGEDAWEYGGHQFDFLWRKEDGEPFDAWMEWAIGREWPNGYVDRPFDGKEPPYELRKRLDGEEPWDKERGWRTAVWWALDANVMWAFTEDGHLPRLLASMQAGEAAA